jgi:hypothetical protein
LSAQKLAFLPKNTGFTRGKMVSTAGTAAGITKKTRRRVKKVAI